VARTASDELQRAVALTREAGAIAMRHFRRAHAAWEKAPGDLVTAFCARGCPRATPTG
jgi:fructose-1,6-bisphosphatase/inositol monophosphatase family enzyme